ncbi:hypothetical protein PFISCL1PPCAC_18132, partial [Pristionchus fissidentatus]
YLLVIFSHFFFLFVFLASHASRVSRRPETLARFGCGGAGLGRHGHFRLLLHLLHHRLTGGLLHLLRGLSLCSSDLLLGAGLRLRRLLLTLLLRLSCLGLGLLHLLLSPCLSLLSLGLSLFLGLLSLGLGLLHLLLTRLLLLLHIRLDIGLHVL